MKHRQEDSVTRRNAWAAVVENTGGRIGVVVVFAAVYTFLVWQGSQS